jgi:DNA-binding response OmpR family regulator
MQGHILLVDDEPYFRFSTELALRKRGYLVSQAGDGVDALERILCSDNKLPPFDLILLDLELPTLCGVEIMRRLHQEAVAIPVLVISGYFNAERYEELMRLGSIDILFKPVSEQMLLERVEEVLKYQ